MVKELYELVFSKFNAGGMMVFPLYLPYVLDSALVAAAVCSDKSTCLMDFFEQLINRDVHEEACGTDPGRADEFDDAAQHSL